MSATYSIGRSVAQRLRALYPPAIGGAASVDRLERGEGTEDDIAGWARYCEALGDSELAAQLRAMVEPITVSGPSAGRPDPARPAPCPDGGEHPYDDVTLTFGRRLALRRLAEGVPLADLAVDAVMVPLVKAGLVDRAEEVPCESCDGSGISGDCEEPVCDGGGDDPCAHPGDCEDCEGSGGARGGYELTAEGRAYLAAHDEARTRRTERPGPPKVPGGWRRLSDGLWEHEGLSGVEATVDLDGDDAPDLDARIEAAEATVDLLRYLRALRVYQSREAGDDASRSPSAVSGDTGRSGEPSRGAP